MLESSCFVYAYAVYPAGDWWLIKPQIAEDSLWSRLLCFIIVKIVVTVRHQLSSKTSNTLDGKTTAIIAHTLLKLWVVAS